MSQISPLVYCCVPLYLYHCATEHRNSGEYRLCRWFFLSKRTYNNSCPCFDFSDLPHSVKFNIFPYLLKTLSHATSLEAVAFVMVPVFKPYWGFSACGCWRTLKIIKIQNIFFNLIFCVDRRNIERECCIVVFQPTLHSHVCTWL